MRREEPRYERGPEEADLHAGQIAREPVAAGPARAASRGRLALVGRQVAAACGEQRLRAEPDRVDRPGQLQHGEGGG